MTKTTFNKKLNNFTDDNDWQEFYGLYGDIGRSEEDIKLFISQRQNALIDEIVKRLEEKKEKKTGKNSESEAIYWEQGFNSALAEAIRIIEEYRV